MAAGSGHEKGRDQRRHGQSRRKLHDKPKLDEDKVPTWTPKVCKIMAFMAIIRGLGLLFYILLGFRYELALAPELFVSYQLDGMALLTCLDEPAAVAAVRQQLSIPCTSNLKSLKPPNP